MEEPAPTTSGLHRVALGALILVLLGYDAVATGWLGFNERVVAMSRNVVLPGLGFIETDWLLTAVFVVVASASVVAWLRWGTDWIVGVVWVAAVVVAFLVVPTAHEHAATAQSTLSVERSSHEFAAVLVIITVLGRARVAICGLPGVRRLASRRVDAAPDAATAMRRASPTERCRAIAIGAVARRTAVPDAEAATTPVDAPDVLRRAARVQAWARWRVGGDPLRHDNAHALAALALTGRLSPSRAARLRDAARRSPLGVPASEPTWVRLLDGTLAAIALDAMGHADSAVRWRAALAGPLRLRHGRRHHAVHTPTLLRITNAPAWEHAAATALARRHTWIGDEDWTALRQRSLGAAARGARRAEDARLVAAARLWAHLTNDAPAAAILGRPTRSTDPIAAALDAVFDAASRDALSVAGAVRLH